MQHIDETDQILDNNGYPICNIILETVAKFKLKTILHKSGFVKRAGYAVFDIILALILMPLMGSETVFSYVNTHLPRVSTMQKDTIYRFINNERLPWRSLLMQVFKAYIQLIQRPNTQRSDAQNENIENSTEIDAFIIDDTDLPHTSRYIEQITRIYNHVIRKTIIGFKGLFLAYFDGENATPVDCALVNEKKFPKNIRDKQYKKDVKPKSAGKKRRKEAVKTKIDLAIEMIKRAVKHGILPKYVLCDSFFTSENLVKSIRNIKNGAMHVIACVRKDKRKYDCDDGLYNANEIILECLKSNKASRCRSLKLYYYMKTVVYHGIPMILCITRYSHHSEWRCFICTDLSLTFIEIIRIYGIRWAIEVMFKEMKQYLKLAKCHSRDFDAQIANITVKSILYIFLVFIKRTQSVETVGTVYREICGDLNKRNLFEMFWTLFEELLPLIINMFCESNLLEFSEFQKTAEYRMLRDRLQSTFLPYQIEKTQLLA
jgi:hypothetical protein